MRRAVLQLAPLGSRAMAQSLIFVLLWV